MIRLFWGIVLLCFHTGGFLQYLLPFFGAIAAAVELFAIKKQSSFFKWGFIASVLLIIYNSIGGIIQILDLSEAFTGSLFFAGRTILMCVLLAALYLGIRQNFGEKFMSLFSLSVLLAGTAVFLLLDPVYHFHHDIFTMGMVVLVYVFALGYVFTELRLVQPEGNRG